jgi:hypothetical protein
MSKAENNQWLIVKEHVVLTAVIEEAIVALDGYFSEVQLRSYVTSGYRSPVEQLRLIQQYLIDERIDHEFSDTMTCNVDDVYENGIYLWQRGWSKLLNIGYIINPPYKAKCLFNYIDSHGRNRLGQYISQTPHASGRAFDIGGAQNGIHDELAVVMRAKMDLNFSQVKAEHNNNCVHVGV